MRITIIIIQIQDPDRDPDRDPDCNPDRDPDRYPDRGLDCDPDLQPRVTSSVTCLSIHIQNNVIVRMHIVIIQIKYPRWDPDWDPN